MKCKDCNRKGMYTIQAFTTRNCVFCTTETTWHNGNCPTVCNNCQDHAAETGCCIRCGNKVEQTQV